MNNFGIGGWEMVLVAIIAMLVLGPERMVQHAFRAGRWARKLSRYWQGGVAAFREQLHDLEEEADIADLPDLLELRGLASELRLPYDDLGPGNRIAPDNSSSEPAKVQVAIPSVATTRMTYNAWTPPKKHP